MGEINNAIDIAMHELLFYRYPAEAVRQLEQLEHQEVAEILSSQPIRRCIKVWERLSPEFGTHVLEKLPADYGAELLDQIDPNRGAGLILGLDEDRKDALLKATSKAAANDINRAIAYEPNSAGALMDARVVYFRPDMTVGEALRVLRAKKERTYRKIYTVDDNNQLTGMIEIEDLALADHDVPLTELQRPPNAMVEVTASREEVVDIFEKYKLTDLPVIDFDRRLVGVIRHHVLVAAAREESSADLLTMVGASKDERALSPAGFAVRKRLPWLEINLVTAFMAAAVVGLFEATIAQYTALAVLLPVVAGQSGNTGAQSLAVTMRGLALKEIYPRMWLRILFKEVTAGFWNGFAVAITTGIGVYIWSQSVGLTLVIVMSMVLSMIIASVSGAAIPIMLTVSGQDPAQSSSIFLTTITDIAGFFSFLGIATLFITML